MLEAKTQKTIIWILLIGGYLLATIILPFLITMAFSGRDLTQINFAPILIMAGIDLIVWIPVTLIAFRILKNTGFKIAVIFLVAAIAVTFLLTRGCWSFA